MAPIQPVPTPPMKTPGVRSLSLIVLLTFSARLAAQEAAAPFAGTWKGVYFTYPNLVAVELTSQCGPDGAITGQLSFHEAVKQRSAFGQVKGSFQVAGRYEPASRTWVLKPGTWIEQSNLGGFRAPMVGVFDARSGRLAGTFDLPSAPNPIFLVLAPGAAGDQLIAAVAKCAYPPEATPAMAGRARQREQLRRMEEQIDRMSQMPRPPNDRTIEVMRRQLEAQKARLGIDGSAPEWEAPAPDKLLAWAGRFGQEMPGMSLQATNFEVLFKVARNLFEDSWFKQFFGMTYEEMTAEQRLTMHSAFAQASMQGQSSLHDYAFLGRPFQTIGDFGPPDIIVSVYWQRAIRAWLADTAAIFAGLPAERASFDHLASAEAAGAAELPYLWPGEKLGFATALADNRARLAVPVLNQEADALIGSAAGNAGARQLAAWNIHESDLLKYAPAADRTALQRRIGGRLDELLEQLVAADTKALAALGHGLPAVEAGNAWYQRFKRSYDFAENRPAVMRGLQQFQQGRARTLAEARSDIMARIDDAQTEGQLEATVKSFLACPGDGDTETGVAVRKRADQRLAAVKEKEMMALFSARERSMMDRPGHIDVSKWDNRPPDDEEMRLALLRSMAYGSGKMIDAHTARMTSRLVMFLVPVSMIVKIDEVHREPLGPPAPAGAVAMEDNGMYYMKYRIRMEFSLPQDDPVWNADPNFRQGAQMAATFATKMSALTSEEDNYEDFKLYSDGWGVPQLREQGAASGALDAMVKMMTTRR